MQRLRVGKLDQDLNRRGMDELRAEAAALRWAVNKIRTSENSNNRAVREGFLYVMLPEFEKRRKLVYPNNLYSSGFDDKSVRLGWLFVMDSSSQPNGANKDLAGMDRDERVDHIVRIRTEARKLLKSVARRSEKDYAAILRTVPSNGVSHLRRKG
jgi:hypothetical protein